MSTHWISAFHYSNWLDYFWDRTEETIFDIVCEKQYMQFYSGNSQSIVTEHSIKHGYNYNILQTTMYVTETKGEYSPKFEWSNSYVAIINKKYTVHIGFDAEKSKEFVKDYFSIGTKFNVTKYLSTFSFLSTEKTSAYLWPNIQIHSHSNT